MLFHLRSTDDCLYFYAALYDIECRTMANEEWTIKPHRSAANERQNEEKFIKQIS